MTPERQLPGLTSLAPSSLVLVHCFHRAAQVASAWQLRPQAPLSTAKTPANHSSFALNPQIWKPVNDGSFALNNQIWLCQPAKPAKNRLNSLESLSTEVFSKRRKTCAL